ncbi:MAG: hypothetical protein KAT71_01885 [Gammaproteobacteria bacterium]|nr:hypothetical protein [Gammaproteobacteria bacterium]
MCNLVEKNNNCLRCVFLAKASMISHDNITWIKTEEIILGNDDREKISNKEYGFLRRDIKAVDYLFCYQEQWLEEDIQFFLRTLEIKYITKDKIHNACKNKMSYSCKDFCDCKKNNGRSLKAVDGEQKRKREATKYRWQIIISLLTLAAALSSIVLPIIKKIR